MAEKLDRFRRMSGGPNPNKRITVLEKAMEETLLDVETLETAVGAPLIVEEGGNYSGGVDTGIMFNDGSTFATSSNLTYNNELIVNSNGVSGSGGGRERVVTFKGTLPEILILDTTYRGFAYSLYNNQVYFRHTNTSGAYVNNVGQIQLSSGKWTIGDGTNSTGQLDVNVQLSSIIGQRINLANGQTADAFQINSYGNTGGDLLYITSSGKFVNADIIRTSYDGTTTTPAIQIGDSEVGLNGLGYDSANGIRIITGGVQSQILNKSQIRFKYWEGGGSPAVSIYATDAVGTTNGRGSSLVLSGGRSSGNANGGDIIFKSSLSGVSGTSLNSLVEVARITNSGNVGIGTTSPNYKLESHGDAYFTDFSPNLYVWDKTGGAGLSKIILGGNIGGGRDIDMSATYGNTMTYAVTKLRGTAAEETMLHLQASYADTTSGMMGLFESNPQARFHTTLSSDLVGHRLDLSNGQTENAVEVYNYTGDIINYADYRGHGYFGGEASYASNIERQLQVVRPASVGNANQAETIFLGIGQGNQYSTGYGVIGLVNGLGTAFQLFEIRAHASTPSIRAIVDFGIQNNKPITSSSTDVGASVGLLNFDSSNRLDVGPRYSRGYSTRFWIGDNTVDYTWNVHDGSVELMRLTGGGNLGIGTSSIDSSAILELQSTSKGFAPPVMTGAQVEAIPSPKESLMVYATDAGSGDITGKGWWGYNGTNWIQLG